MRAHPLLPRVGDEGCANTAHSLFSTPDDRSIATRFERFLAYSPIASTVVLGSGRPPDPAGAYLGVAAAISTASAWERTMVLGLVAGRPMHMAASLPGRRVLQTCSDSIWRVTSNTPKSCRTRHNNNGHGSREDEDIGYCRHVMVSWSLHWPAYTVVSRRRS